MANLRPGEDLVDVGNVFDEALAKAINDSESGPAGKAESDASAQPAATEPVAEGPTAAPAAPAATEPASPGTADAAAPATDKDKA